PFNAKSPAAPGGIHHGHGRRSYLLANPVARNRRDPIPSHPAPSCPVRLNPRFRPPSSSTGSVTARPRPGLPSRLASELIHPVVRRIIPVPFHFVKADVGMPRHLVKQLHPQILVFPGLLRARPPAVPGPAGQPS